MDNKDTLTEIVFILDKSGSMESILDDTIGGFNSFLREQKAVDGDANMTLIQFSTNVTRTFVGKDLQEVEPLTKDSYSPSGWTALLDAMGIAITETVERIAKYDRKPDKVIVITMTDGAENKSTQFNATMIKNLVNVQQDKCAWEFVFLGANQDAFLAATEYGIGLGQTMSYTASPINTTNVFDSLARSVTSSRLGSTCSVVFDDDDRHNAVADFGAIEQALADDARRNRV